MAGFSACQSFPERFKNMGIYSMVDVILMSTRITARFTMYRIMVIHNGQIYLNVCFLPVPGFIIGCISDV